MIFLVKFDVASPTSILKSCLLVGITAGCGIAGPSHVAVTCARLLSCVKLGKKKEALITHGFHTDMKGLLTYED